MTPVVNTNEIAFESTSHGKGLKKVLLNAASSNSSLTQVAIGKLMPGEKIESHVHPTMDEIFYFLKGTGEYIVDEQCLLLRTASFIKIPAGIPHALNNTGNEELEFFYFGVSTDPNA